MRKVRCTSSPLDLICHFSEVYDFDVNCNDCWKQFNRFIGLDCRYVVKIHGDEHSLHFLGSPGGLSHLHLSLRLEFLTALLLSPPEHTSSVPVPSIYSFDSLFADIWNHHVTRANWQRPFHRSSVTAEPVLLITFQAGTVSIKGTFSFNPEMIASILKVKKFKV